MTITAKQGLGALTEKEKQTLRMIVRGHDAKSIARSLNLSVHTINERLREARRKVAVSSSREAARLLFEAEDGAAAPTPDSPGDTEIGDAASHPLVDLEAASIPGAGRRRRPWPTIGVALMLPALALLAFAAATQLETTPTPPATVAEAGDPAAVAAALNFVTLIDQKRWDASYAATGAKFHTSNTLKVWTDVSEKVRAPLGALVSRTVIAAGTIPAPPHGYEMVKFRSQFTNKTITETVALDREQGDWRVVGIVVD
jgi:DNA-binding CsgD family transcriptional regulator